MSRSNNDQAKIPNGPYLHSGSCSLEFGNCAKRGSGTVGRRVEPLGAMSSQKRSGTPKSAREGRLRPPTPPGSRPPTTPPGTTSAGPQRPPSRAHADSTPPGQRAASAGRSAPPRPRTPTGSRAPKSPHGLAPPRAPPINKSSSSAASDLEEEDREGKPLEAVRVFLRVREPTETGPRYARTRVRGCHASPSRRARGVRGPAAHPRARARTHT